ncbi:collagenase-like [Schistocerca nitens]|uniref:collagenase-like n=1 Tax=Schistocerca nitens TaxID=7011 RepID=UPI0021174B94|nr:collagenase-like [Schistocerca nitens]
MSINAVCVKRASSVVTMQLALWALFLVAATAQELPVHRTAYDVDDNVWGHEQSHRRTGRVVGGGQAARGQFKHVAYVNVEDTTACGAALLNSKWLLTAGVCLSGYMKWVVYLGIADLTTSDDYSLVFQSNTRLEHPGLNTDSKLHNIGLIYVPSKVNYNDYIQPVQLPRYADVDSTFEGVDVMVSGWGAQATGGAAPGVLWYAYFQPVTICSPAWSYCGVGRYNEAICSGDFGSPMQRAEADGNYTVVGVASFIQGTTTCEGATSGFVMVAAYLDWLARHTGLGIRP